MAAITICTVSGTIRDFTGTGISGVTIKANSNRPFIHPTDNSLIMNYEVTATSAADGTWSMNLIETTTPATTLTISFYYPSAVSAGNLRKDYTVQIPNAASATFQSLIGTQV